MGRSFKSWARTALAAGWVVLAGGCAAPAIPSRSAPSTPPARPLLPTPPPPQSPAAADQRFIIAPELERVIRVVSVSLTNPPGAYLKIQVNLQNMTGTLQKFSYRLEWFDKDGARLPVDEGEFSPWTLAPHEESSIAATAPAPAAADFGIAFVPSVN